MWHIMRHRTPTGSLIRCLVVFYATVRGNEPVLDWLSALGRDDKRVIGSDLWTVQEGFPIGMPVCSPLGDGLYEVRSSLSSRREARLLFFQSGTDLVVVEGFIKKSQTTPKEVLKSAKARKAEYEAASKDAAKAKKT